MKLRLFGTDSQLDVGSRVARLTEESAVGSDLEEAFHLSDEVRLEGEAHGM